MTVDQFRKACGYDALSETDKVCYLAFFNLKRQKVEEFSVSDAARWLIDAGGAAANQARLAGNLRKSKITVKAPKGWRLKGEFIRSLEAKYPSVSEKVQEVLDAGTILPASLYGATRGYIESLAKQINSCYENNIYDGCAVLMRRLEEILLIHSYEKLGIESFIKDGNGSYFMLEGIVKNAEGNATLNLSRNSKKSIETIRELGNFSAHKISYTCRREYIEQTVNEYRALVEELLHKSGIRK